MEWEQVIEEIKRRTRREAIELKIQPGSRPGIFDSKFGGLPYWNPIRPYPEDSKGNKLMLLAQVNLDRFDAGEELPCQGMLQFFHGMDDVFGMDFSHPDKQDTFRVVYHEKVDRTVTKEQILALQPPVSTDPAVERECASPVLREAAVSPEKKESFMGPDDGSFDGLFYSILEEKYGMEVDRKRSLYDFLGSEAYDRLVDEFSNTGHWMLGYPFFTQFDPRAERDSLKRYDILLFQMDSEMTDKEDYVLWGDCGVGSFFINHEDLRRKDFSRVLYTWDCC